MALSRAFTTRRAQPKQAAMDADKLPQRSNTTNRPTPILRHKISAPVQLIHTTNMLSYNAPDLPRPNRSNSSATSKTDEDSEGRRTAESTPPTSPDEEPGVRPCSPEPNHLSTYFAAPSDKYERARTPEASVPVIPKRSPTHTKKNSFDAILRSRSIAHLSRESEQSVSSKASYTFSRTPSTSTRASSNSHNSAAHTLKQTAPPVPPPVTSSIPPQRAVKESHPFGPELAQVTELAEEYGTKTKLKTINEDEQYIESKGLFRHCAGEYLDDIQSLSASFFPERLNHPTSTPLWI